MALEILADLQGFPVLQARIFGAFRVAMWDDTLDDDEFARALRSLSLQGFQPTWSLFLSVVAIFVSGWAAAWAAWQADGWDANTDASGAHFDDSAVTDDDLEGWFYDNWDRISASFPGFFTL